MPGCRLIGVGQDEDPQPLVRRADLCRREQARRRRVAQSPKLSQDGFKAEGDVTGDVFEEDPFRAALADDPRDVGPEVAGIIGPAALSSRAEGLAGIACALGCDEDRPWPVLPFDEGAGVIAGFGEHEAQIKASAACTEGQSVPGT